MPFDFIYAFLIQVDKTAVFHAKTEDLENIDLVRKKDMLTIKSWCSNSSASDKKKFIGMIKTSGSERTQNSKKELVNRLKKRKNWIALDKLQYNFTSKKVLF